MKEIFFLSGLPRAGNTLFGSLMNQNPDVAVTANSITADTMGEEGLHTIKTDAIVKSTYDAYSIIPKSIIDKYEQCNFWKG